MSDYAITVEGLGKRYRIGGPARRHDTFARALVNALGAPVRNLAHLRSLSRFREDESEVVWALREVAFEVRHGEVLGIIGRNGAGKSTLLKILSRITRPTTGRARVQGRVGSLLEVGTGFHPELSGRDNVYLNGSILGMDRAHIAARFDEIVEFSGVAKFIDTPVKRYSSGMYLRLAFSVAAHLEPDVLVVDEVLAVGDAEFQKKCIGKMGEVAGEGRTVLFVSHNMGAVGALCSRALLLASGTVRLAAPVDEVIAAYTAMIGTDQGADFQPTYRAGSGAVRVTALSVSSEGCDGTVLSDRGMRIRVGYAAREPEQPIQFLVGIYDSMNVCVFFLDSLAAGRLATRFPRAGTVQIEFNPDVSLTPGRYTLNVATVIAGELADHIQGALAFDVQEGDFFGTGRAPSGRSAVWYRNTWKLEADAESSARE